MKVKEMKYHSMGTKEYCEDFAKELKTMGYLTKIVRNKENLFALYWKENLDKGN